MGVQGSPGWLVGKCRGDLDQAFPDQLDELLALPGLSGGGLCLVARSVLPSWRISSACPVLEDGFAAGCINRNAGPRSDTGRPGRWVTVRACTAADRASWSDASASGPGTHSVRRLHAANTPAVSRATPAQVAWSPGSRVASWVPIRATSSV